MTDPKSDAPAKAEPPAPLPSSLNRQSATALVHFINMAVALNIPVPPALWESAKGAMVTVQNVSNGAVTIEERPVEPAAV